MWTLTTDTDALAVKKESELMINASSAGSAMAKCPTSTELLSRSQRMGTAVRRRRKRKKVGTCSYHVSGLTPTMGGDWLLHLQLKEGSKTTTAVEFNLKAQ